MLRTSFSWLLLPLLAFVVAACCGSVACDDRERNADTLFFKFAPSVTPQEISTVYIVRTFTPNPNTVPAPTSLTPVRDTARLISNPISPSTNDTLSIGNNTPFVATANRKLNAYTYEIYTLNPADTTGKTKALSFTVDNILLEGGFNDEDGCCTYYKNTKKIIDLDNGDVPIVGLNLTSKGTERRYATLQP
ncbi:hypothetical protein F1C16_12065 [Hymenobacter sp. NBH84]|uniref:hypothetical protein n=1 Tax=Hymenobacter sp. NBH84 TaxID=2596915 RepID=UPI001629FBB1|nr:hypothetical protein [Hymenobacter sp. NBH84]QNE40242.1 hypothetical protein F1C16_12065 [Hymenobacter sp. NBH84]